MFICFFRMDSTCNCFHLAFHQFGIHEKVTDVFDISKAKYNLDATNVYDLYSGSNSVIWEI